MRNALHLLLQCYALGLGLGLGVGVTVGSGLGVGTGVGGGVGTGLGGGVGCAVAEVRGRIDRVGDVAGVGLGEFDAAGVTVIDANDGVGDSDPCDAPGGGAGAGGCCRISK